MSDLERVLEPDVLELASDGLGYLDLSGTLELGIGMALASSRT
jgi:hypothetical protein